MEMNDMDFGAALAILKEGGRVYRRAWRDKGSFLLYVDPYASDQYSVREKPNMVGTLFHHIVLKTADNAMIPWTPSQLDMLGCDWIEEAIVAEPVAE